MNDLFSETDIFPAETEQKTVAISNIFGPDFLSPKLKAKELSDSVSWVITQRKVEFLTNLLQLKSHKSVQIRRKVAEGVAMLGDKNIIPSLQEWQILEADRETWLVLESGIDKLSRGLTGLEVATEVKILSVTEALKQVKRLLGEQEYIIEGELSEVKAIKQMYYFGIKDALDTRLDCGAFVGAIMKAGFPLNEGLQVRVEGTFKLSKFSKLYFDVKKIQLTGEGELLRNLKMLEAKLQQEGLFDEARKKPIPKMPQKILLIASLASAALTDFTKVLQTRRGGLEVYHLPIKTQGVGAEAELLESLKQAREFASDNNIDTIVLTRGGGSKDDLIVFNSEAVVRALAALPKPTIVAIGHERDVSLAELVADLRASTPSQAAELVSVSRQQILLETENFYASCCSIFQQRFNRYKVVTNQLWQLSLANFLQQLNGAKSIVNSTDKTIYKLVQESRNLARSLSQNCLNIFNGRLLETHRSLPKLQFLQTDLLNQIHWMLSLVSKKTDTISQDFTFLMQQKNQQAVALWESISLYDSKKILDMGYVMVFQTNKLIGRKQDFNLQKSHVIKFADGQVETKLD